MLYLKVFYRCLVGLYLMHGALGLETHPYADPTKGAANGAKVADIEMEPEM